MTQLVRIAGLMGGGAESGGGSVSYDNDQIFGDISTYPTYSGQPSSLYISAIDTTVWFEQAWNGAVLWIWCKGIVKSTGAMVGPFFVGANTIANDNHGIPVPAYDQNTGYIYCCYGSHATPLSISKSDSPNDITAWTDQTQLAGQHTYPKLLFPTAGANAGKAYLFTRDNSGTAYQANLTKSSAISGAGVITWAAPTTIFNLGADSRVNMGPCYLASDGHSIHGVFCFADNADTYRANVYYFIYDTNDDTVYSYNLGWSSSSYPIDKATINANLLVVNQGSNEGNTPTFAFDSSGNSHVAYMEGAVGGPYSLYHIWTDRSTAWSSPALVGAFATLPTSATHRFDGLTIAPLAAGAIDIAWVSQSTTEFTRGGNISKRTRASDGTLGTTTVIFEADSSYANDGPNTTLYGTSAGRLFGGQIVNDETAEDGHLKAWAYGDSGKVKYNYSSLARSLFSYISPLSSQKFAIDEFLCGMDQIGLWSTKVELFYIAFNDFTTAAVNWANPGNYSLTEVGSPTFTALACFKGNGTSTKYRTNFTPSTQATKATQNSFGLTVDIRSADSENDAWFDMGGGTGPFSQLNTHYSTGDDYRGGICTGTASTISVATPSSQGFHTFTRTASNLTTWYRNTASQGTTAQASTGLPNGVVDICGTGAGGFSPREIRMACLSAGRTATQEYRFYANYLKLRWQLGMT